MLAQSSLIFFMSLSFYPFFISAISINISHVLDVPSLSSQEQQPHYKTRPLVLELNSIYTNTQCFTMCFTNQPFHPGVVVTDSTTYRPAGHIFSLGVYRGAVIEQRNKSLNHYLRMHAQIIIGTARCSFFNKVAIIIRSIFQVCELHPMSNNSTKCQPRI